MTGIRREVAILFLVITVEGGCFFDCSVMEFDVIGSIVVVVDGRGLDLVIVLRANIGVVVSLFVA